MPPLPAARLKARVGISVSALLLCAVIVGCGGGSDPVLSEETLAPTDTEDPTAAQPTATTVPPTPTPVPTPAERSPVNGLPIPAQSTTRIMTIKIDNHPKARPQRGIEKADMMIEIWVEGVTRFLSVWQDSDAEVVGPIRSMRPTDFSIQNSWESLFINSGGQPWVGRIGSASNVQWYVEPAGTFRSLDRRAPHNLYGNTEALRALNTRGDYDEPLEPLWDFGPMPQDASVAERVITSWSNGFVSSWDWTGATWEKSTQGEPHVYLDDDDEAHTVTADTLVVFEMQISSQSGGSGTSAVPVTQTTGSGPAWVFADGKAVQGTWARDTDSEWFTLTGDDGSTISVPPGRMWLILAKRGGVEVK